MDNTNEQRIISFCTGGRMLDRGLERVIPNLRTVAAVEIEAFCTFNLAKEVESPQKLVAPFPIWTDVKTFPSAAFHGKIHGVTGGYPCQPFSTAGKRKGNKDPRHLWPYFERHIKAIRPVWGFFENVAGHLSLGFPEVQASLQSLGYAVEAGIYSAAELGATQVRERLFILATTDPSGLWNDVAHHQGQRERRLPEQLGWRAKADTFQIGEDVANGQSTKRQRSRPTRNGRYGFANNGENVADCNSVRIWEQPGHWEQQQTELVSANDAYMAYPASNRGGQSQPNHPPRFFNQAGIKWPAPPGAPQHAWEAPRVAESGLGCTVDGYNFRADILRMLGNGVVESVAAHAFYDLLLKQAKNFNLIQ